MFLYILDTQPTDIWHDPLYLTILGIAATLLAAIIGAVVAYWIYRGQTRKELSYEVITLTPILSVREEVKDRIQVLFNNKNISNVQLAILRVWNSGNIPITSSDYVEPISFGFGEKAEILDADILETIPNFIKVSIRQVSNNVVLEPILLNSKESIKFKVLLTQPSDDINLKTRIIGLKRIIRSSKREFSLRTRFVMWLIGTCLLVLVTIILLSVTYVSFSSNRMNNLFLFAGIVGTIIGMSIACLALITWVISTSDENTRSKQSETSERGK
jgi:glycerol uptake facilitator-like aquaporin